VLGEREARITLEEGRYHQIRRMFAAAGNHVVALKRLAIGAYELPDDLAEGDWRVLTPDDLARVLAKPESLS
jgi:16S rRNA pseudouridine516 synthase